MYIPIPVVIGAVALILVLLLMRGGRIRRRDLLKPPVPIDLDPAVEDEMHRLIRAGQKLAAIRLVRERSAASLKQAKDLVDRMEPRP